MTGGIVSFVGMGLGDPVLCTLRAAERAAQADVVVPVTQAAAAADLVALARAGKRVVRELADASLDSPSAVDEVRAVARSGVDFEVVPGVGASAVAAAFGGILGGAKRAQAADVSGALDGERADAVVTLMADAGAPTQRLLVTSAGQAAAHASSLGKGSVLVAFGRPDPELQWFERRPLFGKRVLVTRARDQATGTAALLRDHGAEALIVPTIAIHPPRDPGPLARALSEMRMGAYTWVAFTSANGVDRTWDALVTGGGDARAFGLVRLAAIGPATARGLERHGLRADVIAKEFRGEGLADAMKSAIAETGGPARVLVARAATARDVLPEALRAAGCQVDVVAVYETRPPPPEAVDWLVRDLETGRVDAVTFTSSSTVDNLCELLGPRCSEWLAKTWVASIGPITTDTALARGLRVDVTAEESTVRGLVDALVRSWPENRRASAGRSPPNP